MYSSSYSAPTPILLLFLPLLVLQCAYTLRATTLDFYADSNTRQRSLDCMADDTTAALSHYATTAELALPRLVTAQIMAIGPAGEDRRRNRSHVHALDYSIHPPCAGYISPNWADWTVLPALNVVNDAIMTGDLRTLATPLIAALALNHTYINLVDPASGLVHNGQGLGALVDTSGGSDDGFQSTEWNAVVQAWCYSAMTAVASLATAVGRPDLALQLTTAATALKTGFNAAFFNGTAICDGLCTDTPHTSVHSSFYALAFGLVSDENIPAVAAYVRYRSTRDAIGVPCGTYPVQFMLQVRGWAN